MNKAIPFIVLALLLQACATDTSTLDHDENAETLRNISLGNVELDCHFSCAGSWELGGHDEAKKLYAAREWERLALHIATLGYQSDLSYFYLGHAAEGMGATAAALKYYRLASALATGSKATLKCETYSDCDGFDFPKDIHARVEAIATHAAKHQATPTVKPAASSSRAKPAAKKDAQVAPQPSAKSSVPVMNDWVMPPPVTK